MTTPKYFKLEELLTSSTARQKSIENLPSWEIVEHLNELALFLDGIRTAWGKPIHISSGYRNEKLNTAVSGAATSVHMIGYAADIYVAGGKKEMDKFGQFLKDYLQYKKFDQLITETSKSGGYWYHIGLYNNKGEQRCQIKTMFVNK